jgi:cell division protein FtsL
MAYSYHPPRKKEHKPQHNKEDKPKEETKKEAKTGLLNSFTKLVSDNKIKIVAVVFLLAIFTTAWNITGFATYDRLMEIEKRINETETNYNQCQASLNQKSQDLYNCRSDIDTKNQAIDACRLSIEGTQTRINNLTNDLSQCTLEKDNINMTYTSLSGEYNKLLKNSVKYICCRPGITTTNWNIFGGALTCSGSNAFNCVTGEIV